MLLRLSPSLPELLSVPEAARMLGRDAKTVRAWLRTPNAEGVVITLGKRRYVRRQALVDLIAGATPTSPTNAEE